MKKWTSILLGAVLLISLTAACSNGANNTPANSAAPTNASEPAVTDPSAENSEEEAIPTAEELIQRIDEAGNSLKSYSMESTMDQNIAIDDNGTKQEQEISMQISSDIITQPYAAYQKISMSNPNIEGMEGMDGSEQYMTPEGIYVKVNGEWVKLPDQDAEPLLNEMKNQSNPQSQFAQLEAVMDELNVGEEGDNYTLTASLSGEGLQEIAKSYLNQSGGADPQTEAMIEQMDIKRLDMNYKISKETYYPVDVAVVMEMDTEIENQKLSLVMDMTTKFTGYNNIEEIKVPQEAIDSAQ